MSRHVSTLPTTPEEIVVRLRGPDGAAPGYRLNRVILCNYWHFGLLTFDIPHGRLFLTGDNATGKSTALVAAMLTLDGDVRPHRLDTFGSAERQIAAYVLGTRRSGTGGGYEHPSRTSLVATEWAWHGHRRGASTVPHAGFDVRRQCWQCRSGAHLAVPAARRCAA